MTAGYRGPCGFLPPDSRITTDLTPPWFLTFYSSNFSLLFPLLPLLWGSCHMFSEHVCADSPNEEIHQQTSKKCTCAIATNPHCRQRHMELRRKKKANKIPGWGNVYLNFQHLTLSWTKSQAQHMPCALSRLSDKMMCHLETSTLTCQNNTERCFHKWVYMWYDDWLFRCVLQQDKAK